MEERRGGGKGYGRGERNVRYEKERKNIDRNNE